MIETVDLTFTIPIPTLSIETLDYMVLYWLIGVYFTLFWLVSNGVKLARYFKHNSYINLVRATFFFAWIWPIAVLAMIKDKFIKK